MKKLSKRGKATIAGGFLAAVLVVNEFLGKEKEPDEIEVKIESTPREIKESKVKAAFDLIDEKKHEIALLQEKLAGFDIKGSFTLGIKEREQIFKLQQEIDHLFLVVIPSIRLDVEVV